MTIDDAIEFSVPGKPDFKRRPRAVRQGPHVRVHNPPENATAEAKIALFARQVGAQPMAGPVSLRVVAWWPSRKPDRKKNPRPAEPYTSKPDADNVLKLVADALNGVAYLDDAQVARVEVEKWRAAQGDPPRVEVEVRAIGAA